MNVYEFLTNSLIPIRLSCINALNWPITISLWFLYKDNKIFCATQKSAKIVEYLSKNERCGFEVASDNPPYKGVRGYGNATLDEENGKEVLDLIIKKYLKDTNSSLAKFLKSRNENEIAIEIEPQNMFSYDYSNRMIDVAIKSNTQY